METIHKKNGKLHIYVRQDKYKGELKSHNWVGRTYINGKQKISSSGTTNLEEAIPILEKWFDELQLQKVTDVSQINPQKEILKDSSLTFNERKREILSKMRRKQRKLVSDFENRHKRLNEELRKTLTKDQIDIISKHQKRSKRKSKRYD